MTEAHSIRPIAARAGEVEMQQPAQSLTLPGQSGTRDASAAATTCSNSCSSTESCNKRVRRRMSIFEHSEA